MKRKAFVIGGGIVLAFVLIGAAFVGGRLLTGQDLPGWTPGGLLSALSGGGQAGQYSYNVQAAGELPPTAADVRGLFDHRQNGSIFIGTGRESVVVKPGQGGEVVAGTTHDGPTLEVVVTPQTLIYDDVTFKQFDGQPSGGQKLQQVLAPGSLDALEAIGQGTLVTVWGKPTGQRVIADVVVYLPPD
jgi:hypothetical protein